MLPNDQKPVLHVFNLQELQQLENTPVQQQNKFQLKASRKSLTKITSFMILSVSIVIGLFVFFQQSNLSPKSLAANLLPAEMQGK